MRLPYDSPRVNHRRCKSCAAYKSFTTFAHEGWCRKRAPDIRPKHRWPRVTETEWCMDYEPAVVWLPVGCAPPDNMREGD